MACWSKGDELSRNGERELKACAYHRCKNGTKGPEWGTTFNFEGRAMNDDGDRFIGRPEGVLFNFTPEETLEAQKEKDRFDVEVLKELNGNTKPTEEEELQAVRAVLARWFPVETANAAKRKKKEEQFEVEILQELKGITNPTEEEREAAKRRVIDRWYPEKVATYKALLAAEQQEHVD